MDKFEIVYLYLKGDFRETIPSESENFFNWLNSRRGNFSEPICLNIKHEDLVDYIWVTCTKAWLENNFPELIPFIRTKPNYSEYLDYKESNFGLHFLPDVIEYEITDRII